MDYDDNNTQGHNLKVAGESRSNSSSVLRPYAFPRFDIDDSLQGHLRFDNLVETDVFLGIRNQDDNQWIEDFSRGSDGIEFSSSATESCSIPRKNNVWSEAASSESVEMLLKSVGQEQIPPKDTVCKNSNTSNELGGLPKEMEPIFEPDNVIGGSTSILNAAMLQDELLNKFSELENHVGGKLSQVVDTSSSQEKVVEDHGSSSQMHPNDLKEECKLPIPEGVPFPGTKCDDKNGQEAESSFDVCLDQTGDGLSQPTRPSKDINSSSCILVSAHSSDQVSSHGEGIDALIRATGDGIKVQLTSEDMAHLDTQIIEQQKLEDAVFTEVSHSFSSSVECLDKQTDVEVIINTNEFSMMSCAEECQFQLLEGRNEDNSLSLPALPGRGQTDVLSTSRVIHAASTESDFLTENSEQHDTELSNLNGRYCSSSGAKLGSVEESDKKLSSDEGGPGNEVLVRCCQSSLIKGENKPSIDNINTADIGDLGESLGCPVSSSSDVMTARRDGSESIKDLHDASAVNVEGSRSSGYKEDFEVEADMQSNVRETGDVSVEIKKEENFSLSTCDIDASPRNCVSSTSDEGPSAMMRNRSYDEPIVNQPHSENACKIETEANLILHKINNIVEGNTEDVHKQPFVREISDADVNERSCGRMSVAVSLSNLDGPVQVASEVDSTCKSKSVIHHESTASQHSGADGNVTPAMETCNVASGSESPSANSIDCSKSSEVHPDCDDSVLNKDPQKLECNSPTIISSVVLSSDESKQEGDVGSDYAENKPSASEDLKGKDTPLDDNNFTFKVNLPPNVEREKAITWAPFPIVETYKSSVVLEGVTTPGMDKIQAGLPPEPSGSNPGDHTHGMSKATSGRKRRTSGKGVAKENSQKGVNMMETTPDRPSHKEDTFSGSFNPGSSLPGQFVGSHSHGLTKQKSKKLSTKNVVPTSNVPDLNASALKNHASSSTIVQQPFTELQQVQLRAQIFVYGSLIQGTAPDEGCMISAFASSDKGRDVWEPVWQAAVGRVRSKKSQPASGSPLNTHSSGIRVPDVACKQVSPETKVFPSPVSRPGSKGTPTAILSPIMPLSSPLWSISTPYQDVSRLSSLQRRPVLHYQPAISPLQPYQTPPVQNITGHTNRQSQVPCSPSPWALQTSALNVNARFSTTAITETVKLTPVKGFSLPAPSSVKDIPSPPLVNTDTTSTVFARSSLMPDQIEGSLPSEMPSADSKLRRRKKAQSSNNTAQNPLLSQAHMKMIVASFPTLTSPIALVPSPTCHVTSMGEVFPACSTSQPQVDNLVSGKSSLPSSVKDASSPQLVYTDPTVGSLLSELPSSDSKPRRKKAQPFNNTPQNSLAAQCQTETIVASSLPTLALPLALGTCPSYVTSVRDVFPACSTSQPQVGNLDSGKTSAPSFVKDAPSSQLVYTDTTSTVFTRMPQLPDQTVGSLSLEVPSADSKPRRRKKAQPFNNTLQNSSAAQCQTETTAASIPTIASPLVLGTSPNYVTTSVRNVFLACSTFQPQVANLDSGKAFAPSSVKYAPSPQLVYTDTTSTAFARTPQLPDNIIGSLSSEVTSADSKPRRRKTAQLFDNTPQNSSAAQCQTETKVASSLPTLASPLAQVTSPSYVATPVSDVFPICSAYQHSVGDLDSGKSSACSVETLQKVEYSKLQAEKAAVFAATAISHCQSLWSQLAKQDSRMTREAEAQVAAAAGAAAAAASVAKAAAAAAMVASNAALQAQLMAGEAFVPTAATRDVAQSGNPVSVVHGVGSGTPSSVLTADGGTSHSSSILVVAKEAANSRMQATSAAAKRAENLDSMLEAAKLAAEAVSQAGKVVAMGDPLPLKELISAGPEGYWKLPQSSSELILKASNGNQERISTGTAQGAEISTKEYCGPSVGKILDHGRILSEKQSNDSFDSNGRSSGSISESIVGEKDPDIGKSHSIPDAAQSNSGVSVLHNSSGTGNFQNELELSTVHENNIKEGSAVEIYKDGVGFKPAWFSAHVLTLHDGKALVQYRSLLSKEGSDNLKEWVALEGEGDKAPSIRAALPMTALHGQGTRKRRRSAMGNYASIVGDMVDVWIQDSWCEGVVTEKNEKDETTLTVYFPARGETSAVSAQQLRPSRLWKDGNWVQLSSLSGHDSSNESDMQPEKRPKRLRSPLGSNNSEGAELVAGKPEESKLQPLSASDIVFNVGKSTKAETNLDSRRTLKSGLQREGSRLVCGVPKPGKKRKFVEVSKHFPAAQNRKDNESTDQAKFAKYLMPLGTGRGGKSFSKVDSKDKQSLRVTSLKPHSSSSRTVPQRNNLANSASSKHDEAMSLTKLDVKNPIVHNEHTSKTATLTERGSSGNIGADKGLLGSSFKKSSSSTKAELLEKEKFVPAGGKGKLAKIDEVQVDRTDSIPVEVGEPRRSNRRFQPTHRLLEGLESSMIIPKMLSVSHDKSQGEKSRSTGK